MKKSKSYSDKYKKNQKVNKKQEINQKNLNCEKCI